MAFVLVQHLDPEHESKLPQLLAKTSMLRVALTNSGADVRTCASSADALATIESWKPDCIISDVGMPGADGYELIKKIRALKKKDRAKTPAIALTGFAGADDKLQAIAAGYQHHLSKPVDLGTLTAEIARLAQKRPKARTS